MNTVEFKKEVTNKLEYYGVEAYVSINSMDVLEVTTDITTDEKYLATLVKEVLKEDTKGFAGKYKTSNETIKYSFFL